MDIVVIHGDFGTGGGSEARGKCGGGNRKIVI